MQQGENALVSDAELAPGGYHTTHGRLRVALLASSILADGAASDAEGSGRRRERLARTLRLRY